MRRFLLAGTAALTLFASAAQSQEIGSPQMLPSDINRQTNAASSSGGFTILLLFLILLLVASAQGGGGAACPTCGG